MQIQKDRLYIQHLEKLGEGTINWDAWERVTEETRKMIKGATNDLCL